MTLSIHIPTTSLSENVQSIITNNPNINMIIDYADNNIVSYVLDKEVVMFNFMDYFAMDNRFSSYDIRTDSSGIYITVQSTRAT